MVTGSQIESGSYFYGGLISGDVLEEVAKRKIKPYHEKKVYSSGDRRNCENDGWFFERQLKKAVLMRREKPSDELLEDEVWLIFKQLGFIEMNKDRNFKIQAGSSPKQIDVFAKDEHNIFIIFCTSNKSISLKDEIHKISDLKKGISFSIKKQYGKTFRTSFILVTKDIIWGETDKELASEKQIFYWKDDDLEAYKALVEQLGHAAKYQMYSLLFRGRKSPEVSDIQVPAMRGGVGREKYYCFLIRPQDLFKIAYVHRREKSNPQEMGSTYQRMVNKHRLEKIGEYIDDGKSFKNNVIIAFKQKPTFEPHLKVEEARGISYGILKFPPYYGCAWIIDGQHRLYGYSKSKHAEDHTLPVVAFESLHVTDQANLFVEINQEQKSVNQNLLWDLYPDIYYDSEDEEQQVLGTISLVAKRLNSDENSLFYKHIRIPSVLTGDKKESNLTLTNICEAIRENGLIDKESRLLFKDDYEKTIDFASERINAFFKVITQHFPGDWEKGNKGLLRTNVGLRIFFIILRQLLRYLNYFGKNSVYLKNDLSDFKAETYNTLELLLNDLKNMNSQKIDQFRKGSTKGLVLKSAQELLWYIKEDHKTEGFGAELWLDGKGWSPQIPDEQSNEKIKELVKDTELESKKFVIEKLKTIHGEKWWDSGIPEGVKQNIRRVIYQELTKAPYKKVEIGTYSNEKRFFNYSSTSDLKEAIKYSPNWKVLERIFGDAEYMSSHFKSLENIRNAFIGHEERRQDIDIIIKNLGYWGTRWIRRCMELE